MQSSRFILVFLFIIFLIGCQAAAGNRKDIDLLKNIQSDQETQTAIGAVAGTMAGQAVEVKYCPLCGKHYSAKIDVCSKDGTKLLKVEE